MERDFEALATSLEGSARGVEYTLLYKDVLDSFDFDVKVDRHVRNEDFWGLPVGTLIRAGMKPKGKGRPRKAPVSKNSQSTPRPHTSGPGKGSFAHHQRPKTVASSPRKKATSRGRPQGAGTMDDPIDVQGDLDKAVTLIGEGKHIRLNSPHEVSTLLQKLKIMVDEAVADGKDAKVYDLCKVTVPGTNLFCYEHQGVARVEMPQFKGKPIEGKPAADLRQMPPNWRDENGNPERVSIEDPFIESLKKEGIPVSGVIDVPAAQLKATQSELNGVKVAEMVNKIRDSGDTGRPIFVTREGYILDGHHRWAANVAIDLEDDNIGDTKMPVRVVDMDIGEALDYATKFSKGMGIEAQGAGDVHLGGDPSKLNGGLGPELDLEVDANGRISCPEATGGYLAGIKELVEFHVPGTKRGDVAILTPRHSLWHHLEPDPRRPGKLRITKERKKFYNQIVKNATIDVPPSADPEHPNFYMFGGGSASGKSTWRNSPFSTLPPPHLAVQIDADGIKALLPEYVRMRDSQNKPEFFNAAGFSHEESSMLAKMIQTRAVKERKDIVLDGCGDSGIDKLTKKIDEVRGHGYSVQATYCTVPLATAQEWALRRALDPNDRRFISSTVVAESHQKVSAIFLQAVETGLFDNVELWNTEIKGNPILIGKNEGNRFIPENAILFQSFLAKATPDKG